ncbi:hypothetical protein A0J48_018690 [Sphaerospermopsis aphanizomenoides BCCUSP55]|uniref:Asr1405/Asl0597 family protein n=1 Tax=Sphaerospermopsis aphanizomenoides TaxID=459663 RepID=UPI000A3FE166|nr:Asr1405/Asl0597 family protein [Sphaerospermopsis aphanizomenoides]MBK1989537.1 hypothetical protein [Sphaerospermopsis aphanizomenoides BCCUSP55]
MSPDCNFLALGEQILQIPLSDRSQIFHRLQELMIACVCEPDGSLRVQVNSLKEAIVLQSTVMLFLGSREELVAWLETCWRCGSKH